MIKESLANAGIFYFDLEKCVHTFVHKIVQDVNDNFIGF
jgi:hypothetical protein